MKMISIKKNRLSLVCQEICSKDHMKPSKLFRHLAAKRDKKKKPSTMNFLEES